MRVLSPLTLGISALFLYGCTSAATPGAAVLPPLPTHETYDAPGDRRLTPFLGDWTVSASVFPPAGGEAARFDGEAGFWPALDGRSLRETLTLDGFRSTSTLGFSPIRGRYELVQIDNSTGGQVWMVGLWSADGKTLELEPAEEGQLDGLGFAAMRWEYRFIESGQLVKTIRVRDEAGGVWRVQSEYEYTRLYLR